MALFDSSQENSHQNSAIMQNTTPHEVETIVGPSVKVEGDFNSQGNVLIQGTVSGTIKTDKYLQVEEGAKIMASVRADSVKVSGEVQGNIRAKSTIELTPTARVIGDIEAKTLIIAPGAILHGKCAMLGTNEAPDGKAKVGKRRGDAEGDFAFPKSLVEDEA
jgi:cytoskeletal protein CcmA (bactofilin family)